MLFGVPPLQASLTQKVGLIPDILDINFSIVFFFIEITVSRIIVLIVWIVVQFALIERLDNLAGSDVKLFQIDWHRLKLI